MVDQGLSEVRVRDVHDGANLSVRPNRIFAVMLRKLFLVLFLKTPKTFVPGVEVDNLENALEWTRRGLPLACPTFPDADTLARPLSRHQPR